MPDLRVAGMVITSVVTTISLAFVIHSATTPGAIPTAVTCALLAATLISWTWTIATQCASKIINEIRVNRNAIYSSWDGDDEPPEKINLDGNHVLSILRPRDGHTNGNTIH